MFEEIKKILLEEYGIEDVQLQYHIKKDLGLHSFDFVNLICIFEKQFDVEIDLDRYKDFVTVGDFVDYMNQLVEQK